MREEDAEDGIEPSICCRPALRIMFSSKTNRLLNYHATNVIHYFIYSIISMEIIEYILFEDEIPPFVGYKINKGGAILIIGYIINY